MLETQTPSKPSRTATVPHAADDFMLMPGDTICRASLGDVRNRQREDRADAAFLVEEVHHEEASRYGVCDTNQFGEITAVVEKPDEPPSNLAMTGFSTLTPAIFHAGHLVQPSTRGEYELSGPSRGRLYVSCQWNERASTNRAASIVSDT